MKRHLAILTSGGDAPGMNAAIRAVTRCAIEEGWHVSGVRYGYAGLLTGEFEPMTARSVGGIIQQGGTILGSARLAEFCQIEVRHQALNRLAEHGIDALVVIGGNGSQCGAKALADMGFPVVGVASTIDNDLAGTDIAVGVDTALNIALEAIDRLKITASSHQRAFLVEVMGRKCGYLALMAGIAGGAEAIVLPEVETTPEQVAHQLLAAHARGKGHGIVVVAEGATYNAERLSAYFKLHEERLGFELRTTILGHTQRGGSPTGADRVLATRLGANAVAALARGESGVLSGQRNGRCATIPLDEVADVATSLDPELLALARVLNM